MNNSEEGGGTGAEAEAGVGPGAAAGAGAEAGPGSGAGVPSPRTNNYYCHMCHRPFHIDPEDFFCPYCFGRFIEKMDSVDESFIPPSALPLFRGQSTSGTPTFNPYPNDIPTDPTITPGVQPDGESAPGLNNLAVLMSGNRVRGFHGTINLNADDPLLVNIDWSQLQGAPGSRNPIFVLDSNQVHAITEEAFEAMVSLIWQGGSEGAPPLANDAITSMPDVTVTEELMNASQKCAICWEPYVLEEKVKKLPCTHVYHEGCITPWLKMHATCPICRQNLSPPSDPNNVNNTNETFNPTTPLFNRNLSAADAAAAVAAAAAGATNANNHLNQSFPVLAAMLVQRIAELHRPQGQQQPQQPQQPQPANAQAPAAPAAPSDPAQPPPVAPRPTAPNQDAPPPVPPRPAASFVRDPVAGIFSLFRSLTGTATPSPAPQQQPPPQAPPPSAYYDMDLDFE